MTNNTAVFIPARLESIRFPNKMLANCRGKPLIRYMFDKVQAETDFDVYVITDSELIGDVIPYNVIKTSSWCMNGTERCAEVAAKMNYENIINVQGDFVGVTEQIIAELASWVAWDAHVVTAHSDLDPDSVENPNVVKAIIGEYDGTVIRANEKIPSVNWFTRLPHWDGHKHHGIYGYTKEALAKYLNYSVTNCEAKEGLEQLRWLGNCNEVVGSFNITNLIDPEAVSEIDTKFDLEEFNDG